LDAVCSETYCCEIREFGQEYQGIEQVIVNGDRSTQAILDVLAISGGYHLDSAATWLSFNMTF